MRLPTPDLLIFKCSNASELGNTRLVVIYILHLILFWFREHSKCIRYWIERKKYNERKTNLKECFLLSIDM